MAERDSAATTRPAWTFVTSHCLIFLEIVRNPETTVRELASTARLTERQVHRVIGDLVADGYVRRERVGRRNRYRVEKRRTMRHPSDPRREVGQLLAALNGESQT